MDRRKEDNLSLAAANLLFKSLNLNIENFLTSPLESQKSVKMNSQQSNKSDSNTNDENKIPSSKPFLVDANQTESPQ